MAWLSTSGRYLHPDVQILVSHLEIFSSQNCRTSGNYPEISDMSVVDTQWYPGGWYLRLSPLSSKTGAHTSAESQVEINQVQAALI